MIGLRRRRLIQRQMFLELLQFSIGTVAAFAVFVVLERDGNTNPKATVLGCTLAGFFVPYGLMKLWARLRYGKGARVDFEG